jgi:hypothetical protein
VGDSLLPQLRQKIAPDWFLAPQFRQTIASCPAGFGFISAAAFLKAACISTAAVLNAFSNSTAHPSKCFPHFIRWIFGVCFRAFHGFNAAFWAEKSVFGDFSATVRTISHAHHEQQLSEVENLSVLQAA